MDRRTYIYLATPLFVLLGCGALLQTVFGETVGFIIACIGVLLAWGVVWLRLFRLGGSARPEFAVLSVLPQSIYFICQYSHSQVFSQSPAWQNLYALTWVAFAAIAIFSVRPDDPRPLRQDPIFLLMTPLILIYTACSFFDSYTTLTSL